MFLFKRKTNELEDQIVETRKVELGRETIVLGSLLLDEDKKGDFYIEHTLKIDADACITGNITAARGVIEGRVIGDIVCSEDLQLGATAVIEGVIMTKTVAMESGAIINGKVVLDPDLKVSMLPIKIAEAKDYLAKENTEILSGLTERSEVSKRELDILENIPLQKEESRVVVRQSSVHIEPANESDNWW